MLGVKCKVAWQHELAVLPVQASQQEATRVASSLLQVLMQHCVNKYMFGCLQAAGGAAAALPRDD